ncbi:GH39 family glycosyl hydrolase [Streptomyces griseomycini]|uniref:Xylan 1,4-beta-xylosidase n=1 Tax=Streptomyces griseomycini TaxID=66895 RepID=A0A7W7LYD5_9ACTN|nr:xylan 1,4-beta-xylosidase [Streptomyces griseomycini]MBB4898617.1 xylan 1,4-beta-xylosidase [Streptomyces griseomycini]GGQ02703.1 beta-xylosidase [Streptomyces griseomycini]GGR19867.1 beta-xylosidase [Streptomyces griseomycini]
MIRVPTEPAGRLSDAWRLCVGTGRAELALRRDHQDSLALLQREIGFRYIRGHGLLSDGMGVHRPYTWQGARHVHHSFTYVDQVVDAYLERGIRPFLELGFMPEGLASGRQTVFWWRGNVTPPRETNEWTALVRATLTHLVDRYGADEVRTWPIEVWNEPDLPGFWENADEAAYHRLYEATAHAVKEVDAGLQVGGPAVSPGADGWLERFAEFAERRDVPVDFVSRHAYTSGRAQHVPFGVHQTLAPAGDLLDQFAAPHRELKGTRLAGLPVHITEFNSSYRPDNPVHDTAFHAAYLAPVVTAGGDHADSFSYWTFSDVFEETGVPTAPFHGGFGLLTHRQIKKPTYHLYAFMARMGQERLAHGGDHLVTRHADGRVTVLAWAPVDPSGLTPGPERHALRLSVPVGTRPAGEVFVRRSTVDEEHGNAYAAWRHMGSPRSPEPAQLDVLREAAEPSRGHRRLPVEDGRVDLALTLARHEVTLVELTPLEDETPPWWDERRLLGRETP